MTTILASYDDVRRAARRRLPRAVFDFVDGGAGAEVTLRANRAAFERVALEPRFLVDVAERETATTVLGERVAFPVLLAPAGLARLVHPDGELAAARAAGAAGTIFCVSTASSCPLEEIADAASGPLWFQLYLWKSERVVDGLVDRAKDAGYHALVLTIDVPVVGNRERDIRNGASLRPRLDRRAVLDGARHPLWTYRWFRGPAVTFANLVDVVPGGVAEIAAYVDRELGAATATWDDLDRLRRRWDGPLVVKGILSVEDAKEAVRRGADGVYVSNHGGRQLDGSPATLDALPRIAEAVGDRAEVLLDGGVRRGEDAVRARALGARAVLVGRPWVHALGAGGEAVVARQLALLQDGVDRTLALLGVPRLEDVGPGAVAPHDLAPNDRLVDTGAPR
jgi:L-lactate dehydrogenase (cytochrome)